MSRLLFGKFAAGILLPLSLLVAVPAHALTEWTLHKTANGAHPDGREQQMMWLMNRARQNPQVEGEWLASSNHPEIAGARRYFGVNLNALRSAFNRIKAAPPGAFDVRLYNAALKHSQDMIRRDAQDHNNQILRVRNAGFEYARFRGNVFSYADTALNAHAAFNIDWGYGPNGMQDPPGHRLGLMAVDSDYSSVGMAAVSESVAGTEVGDWVITQNFANTRPDNVTHFNAFVVGTVWKDLNGNATYDLGEGLEGVTVTPSEGSYYAVTSRGGGYAFPISNASGSVTVRFTGGAVAGFSRVVNVGNGNNSVLVDYVVPVNSVPPEAIGLSIDRLDTGEYGRRYGSDRNPTSLSASFTGGSRDLVLSATGYDVDSSDEVTVRLNGRTLGYLKPGGNKLLQDGNLFSIPAMFQIQGTNVIEFYSTDKRWGVTDILLSDVTASTVSIGTSGDNSEAYGWKFGSESHRTVIRARYNYDSDVRLKHELVLKGFNIVNAKQVAVYFNGNHVGYLAKTAKKDFATTRLDIPRRLVLEGSNEVQFHMLRRPNKAWGIRKARLKPAT